MLVLGPLVSYSTYIETPSPSYVGAWTLRVMSRFPLQTLNAKGFR